ncbi:MAG: DUF4262 domain-containing protein [Bacteroidia bacterium]|nr:DUF4262 domain-containing protein [Bacteroidia bacterium]
MTPSDKKLHSDIESHGWHVLKVLADDTGPEFCYSVGLYKTFNHPEILIVGLNLDLAHSLINNIGEDIRAGKIFLSGQFYSNILENFKCLLYDVDKSYYDEYFGYANWYYANKDFPVLQCIYPTVNGVFPWDKNWPEEIKNLQPILGQIKRNITKGT